jgi:hypothetical protein
MLDIWDVKQEEDFMIIPAIKDFFFCRIAILAMVLVALGCKPERDAEVPFLPFEDIYVNLSLPEFYVLQSPGSYKYIDGGVRGIILYRKSAELFYAFERNCTFTPNEACSTVEVEVTGIQMSDPCCGSAFNFEGLPVNGPASRELRQYRTILSGSVLVITDEVINGI